MFIAFDGIDGSGKSTQLNMLVTFLKERGLQPFVFDMGAFGTIGKYINALKHNDFNCSAELREILYYFEGYLFSDFYMENIHRKKGIVICDRWLMTYFAYGVNNGIPYEDIMSFTRKIMIPDLYFFIDVEPEVSAKRILKYREIDQAEIGFKNKNNLHSEKCFSDFQSKVRKEYHKFIQSSNIPLHIIDGNKSQDEIHNYIINKFNEMYKMEE